MEFFLDAIEAERLRPQLGTIHFQWPIYIQILVPTGARKCFVIVLDQGSFRADKIAAKPTLGASADSLQYLVRLQKCLVHLNGLWIQLYCNLC